jgi:hypothetical protein
VHTLVVLALAAAFAAPPEATRDLAAADRLAAANDAAASRATAIVEKSSVACIDAAGAPASVADELEWLPAKFELRVADVLAVPSYQRFARVVARGSSARPLLQAFRAAVARLARQHARLARMRLGFCSFLGDWRKAGWPRSYFALTDQLLETGLVANRIEVGVLSRHLAKALPHVDRAAEVPDRVGRPTREALAARNVVVEVRLVGTSLDELAARVRCLRVPAGFVER